MQRRAVQNVVPECRDEFMTPAATDDTTIYDYLEEIIKHTMFLSPVDDLEII